MNVGSKKLAFRDGVPEHLVFVLLNQHSAKKRQHLLIDSNSSTALNCDLLHDGNMVSEKAVFFEQKRASKFVGTFTTFRY